VCLISDSVAARTLTVGTTPVGGASNNSVESCTAACFAGGYTLAGVEYSDECCTYYPSPSLPSVAHSLGFLKIVVPPSLMAVLQHLPVIALCPAVGLVPRLVVAPTA
jgi:hypothetical protein